MRAWDRESVGESKSMWVRECGKESVGEKVCERECICGR